MKGRRREKQPRNYHLMLIALLIASALVLAYIISIMPLSTLPHF